MDLVRRAGITGDQLGPLAEVLTKAEKNGSLGIRKILQNQKADGGFSLWPSDPEPSPDITLTVLYALKFAAELNISGAELGFARGSAWLSKQQAKNEQMNDQTEADQEQTAFTVLDGYRLSRMAEIGWSEQPWQEEIDYVTAVGQETDPDLLQLIYGLKIFAAQQEQSWNLFNESVKDTNLREAMIEKLLNAVNELDSAAGAERLAEENGGLFDAFGFGFGMPYVVSSALGVLDELGALPPELETQLKRFLITRMKNGYWTSTFDSAQVIFNTRGILSREAAVAARERESGARSVVLRKKDGSELGALTRIPAGFVGLFDEPGSPELLSQLQIDGLGEDEAAFSTISADVPYVSVDQKSDGVIIQRRLYRITATGREDLDPTLQLHKGDVLVSEVTINREPWPLDQSVQSRFLVVEDGVPSLARTIDDDRTFLADAGLQPDTEGYWARVKQTQRHPDKTVRIVEVIPGAEFRLYQVWEVAFAGTASIPPASAFDMYDESIQGNTEARTIHAGQTASAK